MDDQVFTKRATIADREDDYRKQKFTHLLISPSRPDVFTEDTDENPFGEAMRYNHYQNEKAAIDQQLKTKAKDGTLKEQPVKKRRRWDQAADGKIETPSSHTQMDSTRSKGESVDGITPRTKHQWDETPGRPKDPSATPGQMSVRQWAETPAHISDSMTPGRDLGGTPSVRHNRFDETPHTDRIGSDTPGLGAGWLETPRADRTPGISVRGDLSTVHDTPGTTTKKRSRWDETPVQSSGATPMMSGGTPGSFTPSMTPSVAFTPSMGGITPAGDKARMLATPGHVPCTPEQIQAFKWQREIDERNRGFSDMELEELLPPGYKVVQPPPGYAPLRNAQQRLIGTPTPAGTPAGFKMMTPDGRRGVGGGLNSAMMGDLQPGGDLPLMRPDDIQYFDKLLLEVDEDSLSSAELKEREIMKLLLKIKNGTPPIRKSAMRQITSKAKEFGPGPLLNQILPLLMSPTLEDQERHLLVKVIDRILYKLEDKVRPYVHKILVVIEPLLIDEDYYARQEGREIISNLAKAAGLASMISTLRPDIDNMDEYVRNTTARAFAVVAHALGIPHLLPFLKAVCRSKKSWQARHTGIKIVQQIAILMGCAILPHLRSLVEIIEHGLVDEQQKVRTITALALSALAEAATPYGIESFDSVLKPLWKGIRQHRGKGLAAFLKAIGYLIPLMDKNYAYYYTKEVMVIVVREFQSPDEEMKKIVLKVVKQCCGTEGVTADYIRSDILPPFFRHFWNQRMAMDRRNSSQLVETTVEIAGKVGLVVILTRIVDDLKDESEPYRKMVIETIEKVLTAANQADAAIDIRLEEQLIDGILYAFQEQNSDQDNVLLNGFGSIVNCLGAKAKPYIPQICATALFRLQNKSAKVRQQSADLIAKIIVVMKVCNEEQFVCYIGQHMYEFLGEEYPEVLGSILGALKAIVSVIGVERMTPPVGELLPRLTPILKNRHEKVQENCIELVGIIADRGHDSVSGREWMRICFELLELLKAHKKSIRRATVNTFGYIAKAVGPHDVLATLLNNLKVQERQNRVCTTVAIAIVAENCAPFTVLPSLMNEFRVPDLNVQNGVLKSLSFMFEYIGEMAKDYIYAVSPLLEDALVDRDLVHRQTAISAVGHMALGVCGYGCEDALVHLLNCLWPNVLETSPHIVQAFVQCMEGMRASLGGIGLLPYVLQGLFHPAKAVRDMFWKIYNSLYIGNQDGLVAGFPRVRNDGKNQYLRYEVHYRL